MRTAPSAAMTGSWTVWGGWGTWLAPSGAGGWGTASGDVASGEAGWLPGAGTAGWSPGSGTEGWAAAAGEVDSGTADCHPGAGTAADPKVLGGISRSARLLAGPRETVSAAVRSRDRILFIFFMEFSLGMGIQSFGLHLLSVPIIPCPLSSCFACGSHSLSGQAYIHTKLMRRLRLAFAKCSYYTTSGSS